jgi:hypothetical protein
VEYQSRKGLRLGMSGEILIEKLLITQQDFLKRICGSVYEAVHCPDSREKV